MRKAWVGVLFVVCGCNNAPLAEAIRPTVIAANAAAAAATPPLVPPPVPVPVLTPTEQPSAPRPRIMLTMRSTPLGAAASVDGRLVGTTPVRWEMDDDGRSHDFGFVLSGHAPWKLKFSPSRDGVIHATLEAVPESADGGVP